jgi:hypothetical protein
MHGYLSLLNLALITRPEQNAIFPKWAGFCLLSYNWRLGERKKAWEQAEEHLSYVFQAPFLKESPARILQQSLRDLDQAYKNCLTV